MRIANPRLIRLAGLAKGAIIERGDGELIVSPLIQPVIELVSPISRVFNVPQAVPTSQFVDDSIIKASLDSVVGASAGLVADAMVLAKGLWLIKIHASFGFFGTRNVARISSIYLGDPASNTAQLIPFVHHAGVQAGEWQGLVMFDNDGWRLGQARDASVALDEITLASSISAFRVL